jgi:hypothetical protein
MAFTAIACVEFTYPIEVDFLALSVPIAMTCEDSLFNVALRLTD